MFLLYNVVLTIGLITIGYLSIKLALALLIMLARHRALSKGQVARLAAGVRLLTRGLI